MSKTKAKGKVTPAVKKYVKRVLENEIETKNVVLNNNPGSIPDVGTIFLAAGPDTGTNVFERVGYSIKPKKFISRIRLIATTPACIRVLLVSMKQQSTTTPPAIGTILSGLGAGQTDAPLSAFNNVSMSNGLFTVLHDSLHELNVGGGLSKCFTVRPKRLPSKIHYQGTADSDSGKNALYWVMAGSQPVAGNNCTADMFDQLFYEDA